MNTVYVGQTVSHYRILGHIGSGGMGEVYRAEDQHLRRTVALKFLPSSSVADPTARERFIREARAASALDHPNICTIHDIDETPDGRLFISMACYDGETLRSALARGPLSLEDSIGIARQILEGLAKAHEEDITHRDLHPGNILITSERIVKIVDFGLATLAGPTRLTQPAVAAGTLAYMAPEQLRGEEADARSDIWAFGVLLFEMLTGRLPFRGEHSAAMMYAITNSEPDDLALLRREVPGSIVHLCRRCLRKDPDERPQTIQEVLGLFGHWPFEISGVAMPAMKRLLRRYLVPALVAAILLALAVWYFLLRPSGSSEPGQPRTTLGILPFSLAVSDTALHEWPLLAQRLLAADLTGYENAGIVDPLSLNSMLGEAVYTRQLSEGTRMLHTASRSGIALLVDGAVFRSDRGTTLRTTVIRTANGEAVFSCETACSGEAGLMTATAQLARQIIDYVDVQVVQVPGNADMRTWMKRHPGNLAATKAFLLGAQLIFTGTPGSEQQLRASLALDSTFLAPRIWLIPGLMLSGRAHEAHYHIRRLHAMEGSASPFEKAMINWATAFVNNDLAAQTRHLKTALSYSPDNNILLFNLARTQYLLEEFEATVNTLQRPVNAAWAYAPAYYLLGAGYNALARHDEARKVLQRSLTLKGVYPDTYALLACLSNRNGDALNADRYEVKYLAAARDAGLTQAAASATLGKIYLTDSMAERALRHYDVAIIQDPGNAQYHEERGEAFEYCGDTTLAEQCYVRAIACDSLMLPAYHRLGAIADRRGRIKQALQCYRFYLRYDSTSGAAQDVLARRDALQQLTSSHRP